LAQYEFSFSLFWIILILVFVPLLSRLGLWQLERAEEQKQALAEIEQASAMPPAPLDALQSAQLAPLTRVEVSGDMDWAHQFLLGNQVHNTIEGYEVLTPLIRPSGEAILVSRGWIPATPGKTPDLSVPEALRGEKTIIGLAVSPKPRLAKFQRDILMESKDYQALNADPSLAKWPIVIQEEEFKTMSSLLGYELIPRILQPEAELEYAYISIRKQTVRSPAINYGYAAQWFGMAILLICAALFLNRRNIKQEMA
jgi:surfeit locus 1 family protein